MSGFSFKEHNSKITAQLPVRCLIREVKDPSEVIFLLHGYSQTAEKILNILSPALPPNALIVAANGPFLIPQKVDEAYRIGYAWYFYDFAKDDYFIDMNIAVDMWKNFVKELGLSSGPGQLPIRIVGYSQGGYLAPFLAQALNKKSALVTQVIGVSCQFLDEELNSITFRMDAVHGDQDSVVDFPKTQSSHATLKAKGIKGEFICVPGEGHKISPKMVKIIGDLLLQTL